MSQNFTDSVTEALQAAFAEAQRRHQTEVTENHLLWAFLKEQQSYFNLILDELNTHPQTLFEEVEKNLDHLPTYSGETLQPPSPSRSLQARIVDAQNIAQNWKDSYTSSDHFLVSYWKNGGDPFAGWKKENIHYSRKFRTANQIY